MAEDNHNKSDSMNRLRSVQVSPLSIIKSFRSTKDAMKTMAEPHRNNWFYTKILWKRAKGNLLSPSAPVDKVIKEHGYDALLSKLQTKKRCLLVFLYGAIIYSLVGISFVNLSYLLTLFCSFLLFYPMAFSLEIDMWRIRTGIHQVHIGKLVASQPILLLKTLCM